MSGVLVDILALGHYSGEFTASSSCEIIRCNMQIGVNVGAKYIRNEVFLHQQVSVMPGGTEESPAVEN